MPRPDRALPNGKIAVYRHPLAIRLTHWLNVLALLVMLTSGLQIFNAHPALYFGKAANFDHPVMAMGARDDGHGGLIGVTRLAGREYVTTGLFGVSKVEGQPTERAFPTWITLPPTQDLATARLWHFFFAWVFAINGALYLAYGLIRRHIQRDLWPTGAELRHIGGAIVEHARLRFPKGEAARRYNVLQKLSYLIVVLGLLPLMILTGMTMSPGLDAAFPWLLDLFGGRQSARTVHFITATAIVLFVLVHLVMVVAAGLVNEMRSMITGRYVIDAPAPAPPAPEPGASA
ncbi:MAG TPA: cytochrome b/b6 domain-containing protein [Caulobacteraceae bacterium]|jgi:thiosulfate reductase cytochrome b subunit|nr:cytochrome b/b6 domain-containing protein [Caulobacteraceae bacterium]